MNFCKDCKHIKDGHPYSIYSCHHPNVTKVCFVSGKEYATNRVESIRLFECKGKWFEEKPIRWYQFWRK